jgi:hypothetical protein
MGANDERREQENQGDRFRCLGLERLILEIESAQHCCMEGRQIECESRVLDEIRSAACDCHGDSCCC